MHNSLFKETNWVDVKNMQSFENKLSVFNMNRSIAADALSMRVCLKWSQSGQPFKMPNFHQNGKTSSNQTFHIANVNFLWWYNLLDAIASLAPTPVSPSLTESLRVSDFHSVGSVNHHGVFLDHGMFFYFLKVKKKRVYFFQCFLSSNCIVWKCICFKYIFEIVLLEFICPKVYLNLSKTPETASV